MKSDALRTVRDEHASLSAMLRSMLVMIDRGPETDGPERFFDVLRAMLFYIGEFPEKLHHPKESDLLFPRVARAAPHTLETIQRLEKEHMGGEDRVRELVHLLMAWEYLGEPRRQAFVDEAQAYVRFYLAHMKLEEQVVLPAAEQLLDEADRRALDAAFSSHVDPLSPEGQRDPTFDRLFTRIVRLAPSPVGVG
ncbi:MAG: hemerythrin domain-containing protein [Comamonadaceae bacterium]|jgi:hemerythrin-like domain-containing protein|uniref:Hemerythrin domain-containing protein n=1 Tax=Hydrogenophaga borbori TaxID=2294117 RepID=A0A372EJL7_9BURK|nr:MULTISPECIES: hemerythrin domain-containing protein [Hydrogenophaga]NCT98219.1 hemerythrin domain-containing protein [Comamonadaceae bacterium]RFP78742.1 hemerythrin domain-containing protein [Hydrogenophaga borbori]WQB83830.1 hemerythrin domain-containing protein [Hydrogenophaga sp. SNF1]